MSLKSFAFGLFIGAIVVLLFWPWRGAQNNERVIGSLSSSSGQAQEWELLYDIDLTDPESTREVFDILTGDLVSEGFPFRQDQNGLILNHGNWAVLKDGVEGQVRIELEVQWSELMDNIQIVLNGVEKPLDDFWHVPEGYTFKIFSHANEGHQLGQLGGAYGDIERLGDWVAPSVVMSGQKKTLWAESGLMNLELRIDGEEQIRVRDDLYSTTEASTLVAFRAWRPDTSFLRVRIWRQDLPTKMELELEGDLFAKMGEREKAFEKFMNAASFSKDRVHGERLYSKAWYMAKGRVDLTRRVVEKLKTYPTSTVYQNLMEEEVLNLWSLGYFDEAIHLAETSLSATLRKVFLQRLINRYRSPLTTNVQSWLFEKIKRHQTWRDLNLSSLAIGDISFLKGMVIENLSLNDNEIVSVSPLEGMALRRLYLNGNPLVNLDAISGMPLEVLSLSETEVSKLSFIPLGQLKTLYLRQTRVEDLTLLRSAKKLEELWIDQTEVEDLQPLSELAALQTLQMGQSKVYSIEALKNLELRELGMQELPIADISALENMPLQRVDLSGSLVDRLESLRNTSLVYLNISNTPVDDLSPLSTQKLNQLMADQTRVQSLEPLRGMKISRLSLEGCHIVSLDPLVGMSLDYLNIAKTHVEDLSPLRGMNIKILNLDESKVNDLSPLRGMMLITLRLNQTKVQSLEPLRGMKIVHIALNGTPIQSLEPLRHMPIRSLYAKNSKVRSLQPLKGSNLGVLVFGQIEDRDMEWLFINPPLNLEFNYRAMSPDAKARWIHEWSKSPKTAHLAQMLEEG